MDKTVWAAGPLLPSSSFSDQSGSSTTITHDSAIRNTRKSSIHEDQCLEWLNSKAPARVLYDSFSSEVGPSDEELRELALGLEAFIWVLKNHFHDHPPGHLGFEGRIEGLRLIIRGWAPQLLILSHPSTRGFLSHSRKHWPRRSHLGMAHQRRSTFYNAKLLVNDLQIAPLIQKPTQDGLVYREEIGIGVELLMES